jgi:tetratricopeptide (TPR) repeat protein
MILDELANVRIGQGDLSEAATVLDELLTLRRRVYPPDDPRIASALGTLGTVVLAMGDAQRAEEKLREALRIEEGRHPPNDLAIAYWRAFLGEALTQLGDPKAAEPLLARVLESYSKADPPARSWAIAIAESHLGGCLAAQGRFADAEPLLVGGYERLAADREVPPPQPRLAFDRVIRLYDSWAKPDKAAEWRAKGTEAMEASPTTGRTP